MNRYDILQGKVPVEKGNLLKNYIEDSLHNGNLVITNLDGKSTVIGRVASWAPVPVKYIKVNFYIRRSRFDLLKESENE